METVKQNSFAVKKQFIEEKNEAKLRLFVRKEGSETSFVR